MTIKGIVCDFGGVLVLNHEMPVHQKWIERLGMDYKGFMSTLFMSEGARLASIGKISEREFWNSTKDLFNITEQEAEELGHEVFADEHLNIDLINLVRSIPSNIKKAILSNAFSDAREVFTSKLHLDELFDPIVISAEEGIAKPDDEIYLRTIERMGLIPCDCMFIDDLLDNVKAAAKLGMIAIHFQDTESTITQVKSLLSSQGVVFANHHE
ncbi:MAG: HAD family phosphatase [Anaerolineaceae bacterium]|nr:HAD family phosphatase [Anaerolineaceae bacterium]MBN2678543.1 HAD family phosphatase [Anaerolineaceae bacterium]